MLIWCPAEIFTAQSIDLAAEFGAGRFLPWAARAPNRRPATATVLDPSHAAVGIWRDHERFCFTCFDPVKP